MVAFGSCSSTAFAAPSPGSLEEQCIAAGTVLPQEFQGFMFNHHPEKKREPRASDHFQTALETVAEFNAVVPRTPDSCSGHFSQVVLGKAQFQTTKSAGKWLSLRRRWELLPLSVNTLEFIGDPPPLSSFGILRGQQSLATFGLGCTIRGRVKFKLEVVNEESQAIVAVRYAETPLQVDSWFGARCLRKFSIQESSGAHHCGQVIGAKAGKKPSLWGVKVREVSCRQAMPVAQKALETPTFLQGMLIEQSLGEGWHCFYGHRGAASCQRGGANIFLVQRGNTAGEECGEPSRDVRALSQAGTSCDVAGQLAELVNAAPRGETTVMPVAAGQTFTCAQSHYLGLGDRLYYDYVCAAGGAVVSFQIREPKSSRLIPIPPDSISPEVQLPPAGFLGFPRTPSIKFDYSTTENGKVFAPLEVDPALVGRQAELEVKVGTMKCEWTADPSNTDPTCGPTHRVGSPKKRTITLQAKQMIVLGPDRHRGNWLYEIYARTKPFVIEALPYTHALGYGYWSVANEASNCAANPWCHPHRHRAA